MKRFLVISPARAGSTSLRETLDQVNGVVCHGEIFAPARIIGRSRKVETGAFTEHVRSFDKPAFYDAFMNPHGVIACGAKILCHQLLAPVNCYYVNRLLSEQPKVVFVWRRNLLKRMQSEYLLRMSVGQHSVESFANIEEQVIIADCLQQMEMAAWVDRLLGFYGVQVLRLDFESLVADPRCMGSILDFLGFEHTGLTLGKDARSVRDAKTAKSPALSSAFAAETVQLYKDVDLSDAITKFLA